MQRDDGSFWSRLDLHTPGRRGFAALISVIIMSLSSAAWAQTAHPSSRDSADRGSGARARPTESRAPLPALPDVVENACETPSNWHHEALRCRNQYFSAEMVRVVVGASRYAFVRVGDGRPTRAAGQAIFAARLWRNGRLVVPRRVVRGGVDGFGAWGERPEPFFDLLHAYLPTLPALDDDAAERWLRALALATGEPQATATVTREGTRRVLRERVPGEGPWGALPGAVTVIEAWLDDAGAWDVETSQDVATAAERELVPVAVRGSVQMGPGEQTAGDEDFDGAPVVLRLRQRLVGIRACYETNLRASPQLAGRVRVEFTIETTGIVRDVRVIENTTNAPVLGHCVSGTVSGLRVNPAPAVGPVTLSYPFEFSPQS